MTPTQEAAFWRRQYTGLLQQHQTFVNALPAVAQGNGGTSARPGGATGTASRNRSRSRNRARTGGATGVINR